VLWLDTLMIRYKLTVPSLGTKLDDESLRIALGLCLSVPTVVEHTCGCGANVDVFGANGLSCRHSGSHIPQHAAVNEIFHRALVSRGVPAVLEPVGVCHHDGKRPDIMSLIPWRQGLPFLWDFTCSDTLAPSNMSTFSRGASRLANPAESAQEMLFCSHHLPLFPSLC